MNGREVNLHLFHGNCLDVISDPLMRPEWRPGTAKGDNGLLEEVLSQRAGPREGLELM